MAHGGVGRVHCHCHYGAQFLVKFPIYIDYSATPSVNQRVAERLCTCLILDGIFGNPASRSHVFGWATEEAVEEARRQVAELVNADLREIAWTSGAIESDNLAIKGAAHFHAQRGRHLITVKTEHKTVLDPCRQLERREEFAITYLDPEPSSLLDFKTLDTALMPDTILVSVMHVNNEIGVIQDIAAIGELTRARGILFPCRCRPEHGQSPHRSGDYAGGPDVLFGPQDLRAQGHRCTLCPAPAASADRGADARRRPRTGPALRHPAHPPDHRHGRGLPHRPSRDSAGERASAGAAPMPCLWNGLKDMEQVVLNADEERRVAGNLNVSFAYVEGESLIMALKDLAVSSGSACTFASLEPSYVLRAIGREDELAHSSIRFTLGRFSTAQESTTPSTRSAPKWSACAYSRPCGICTSTGSTCARCRRRMPSRPRSMITLPPSASPASSLSDFGAPLGRRVRYTVWINHDGWSATADASLPPDGPRH